MLLNACGLHASHIKISCRTRLWNVDVNVGGRQIVQVTILLCGVNSSSLLSMTWFLCPKITFQFNNRYT